MPINVRRFVWLWWISIGLTLIDILLLPSPSASELLRGMTRSIQLEIYAGVAVIWVAVQLPFFWLAVRRRKNWARWLLLAVFLAGTVYSVYLFFVPPIPPPGVDPSWRHTPSSGIVVGWLSAFAEAAAYYFLFTGDARPWFRREILNTRTIGIIFG
jgi:hypothetical protein